MASLNTRRAPQLPPQGGLAPLIFEPSNTLRTHEGAPAAAIPAELQLRRSVCSCLLWENEFYESGVAIATRIADLAGQVPTSTLAKLAYDARTHFHLRHVPLLLCSVLCRTGAGSRLVSDTIAETIQRPDELTEFMTIYARLNSVTPDKVKSKLSAQAKKGLAAAFRKFDRYQLAKYFSPSGERGNPVRGRDVMFLSHPKPLDEEHAESMRRLKDGEIIQQGGADTWESALGGKEGEVAAEDKKAAFERLIRSGKLGYLALLRNLRNMAKVNVDEDLVRDAIVARKGARNVLPFRYVAAAQAAPQFEAALELALLDAISDLPRLPGTTAILVDVSGSMNETLSGKSDLTRISAACALAAIIPGDTRVFSFSDAIIEIPNCRGLSGIAAINNSQAHSGTYLGAAVASLNGTPTTSRRMTFPRFAYTIQDVRTPEFESRSVAADRIIVITDEQSRDQVPDPIMPRAYMINVASNQNGVSYGPRWTHIDGFSEQVIRFIHEFEGLSTPS